MRKKYILILAVLLIILIIFGLSKYLTQNKNPLSNLNPKDIDSITIRTQMTKKPEQKVVNDKNEISEVIDFLKNIDYKKIGKNQGDKGWGFWITINDLSISFLGNYANINNEVFKTTSETMEELVNLYEGLNSQSLKFP